MHLVQLNIGKFKYPTTDPRMAGFMDNLDRVNAVADRAEGFIWRLVSDGSNNATDLRYGDDDYAVNMSIWTDAKSLENYVFKTVHVQIYKARGDWFEKLGKPHMVFWWVPEGTIPTLKEAVDKLEYYQKHGATEAAFGWTEVMDVERLRSLRCA
jgi:hypothetical protein